MESWRNEVVDLVEEYIIQRYRGAENVKLLDIPNLSPVALDTPTPVGFSVAYYYSLATDRDFVGSSPH